MLRAKICTKLNLSVLKVVQSLGGSCSKLKRLLDNCLKAPKRLDLLVNYEQSKPRYQHLKQEGTLLTFLATTLHISPLAVQLSIRF